MAQAALLGLAQYLAAATAPDREGAEPAGTGGPPFRAADGVWFELEALAADGWLRFWSELGVERRWWAAPGCRSRPGTGRRPARCGRSCSRRRGRSATGGWRGSPPRAGWS